MLAHCLNTRDALQPGLLLQALDTLLGVMPAGLAACFVMLAHCLNAWGALHPNLLLQALDTLLGVMSAVLAACFVMLAHCFNARGMRCIRACSCKLLTPFWVSCQRDWLHALSCWRIV